MHYHKTRLGAQCAHLEPRSCAQCPCCGRCCEHSKPVANMSRAQLAQVARSTCAGRAHSAQVVGACRDLLTLPSPSQGRDITSRSRPPGRPSQVATSTPCRDLPSAQPKQPRSRPKKWGRDTNFNRAGKTMSRHQIGVATPPRPIQVATPKPGRDPPGDYPMSRHQIHVATPFLPTVGFPGRDTKNPPGDYPMSRHQIHVATPFLPTVGFPGRDTKNPGRDLLHCYPCRDIKFMSRRRFCLTKADQVATPLPCSDLTSNQTRSRHQIDVATSTGPNP